MKKVIIIILIPILVSLNSCFKPEYNENRNGIILTLSYIHGTSLYPKPYPNIYAVWIENSDLSYIQNISVCKKLIHGGLTGIALPYWKLNKYPLSDKDEIDAVTGATKANKDFTIQFSLKDPKITRFTVYVEVDRSFDSNDWFKDQPALLYSCEIDLQSPVKEYELKPCGWTIDGDLRIDLKTFKSGILQTDLRYITNKKEGKSFGDIDTTNRATNMVNKITIKVNKQD